MFRSLLSSTTIKTINNNNHAIITNTIVNCVSTIPSSQQSSSLSSSSSTTTTTTTTSVLSSRSTTSSSTRTFISLANQNQYNSIQRNVISNNTYNTSVSQQPTATRTFSSTTGGINVIMPELFNHEKGAIAAWHKQVGDQVKTGDILCEVETADAILEIHTEYAGYVTQIIHAVGTKNLSAGEVLAIISPEKTGTPATPPSSGTPPPPSSSSNDSSNASSSSSSSSSPASAAARLSPAVAYMLSVNSIDPSSIKGSGKKGRILKGDVMKAMASGNFRKVLKAVRVVSRPKTRAATPASTVTSTPSIATATPAPTKPVEATASTTTTTNSGRRRRNYEDIASSNVRKVIASRLSQSKATIPHVYATTDCQVDELINFRQQLKEQSSDTKPPSINDFVIRAAALALRDVPEANAVWDAINERAARSAQVDISVAVSTPAGLITPIVKQADRKNVMSISNELKNLANRARENQLQPHEFQGGSFTISNLGMYGISNFSAVINPPQACILAVGNAEKRATLSQSFESDEEDPSVSLDTTPRVSTVMSVTLSADERVVDAALGARLLTAFKGYMERPESMLR